MSNNDLEDLERHVAEIDRAHHQEMIRFQARQLFPILLGLPLAVGLVAAVVVLVAGKSGDLGQVALGVGATLAVGAVVAVVFWLVMHAWARWRYAGRPTIRKSRIHARMGALAVLKALLGRARLPGEGATRPLSWVLPAQNAHPGVTPDVVPRVEAGSLQGVPPPVDHGRTGPNRKRAYFRFQVSVDSAIARRLPKALPALPAGTQPLLP